MSAHMKKHPTEEVLIEIGNSRKRLFAVPKEKAKGLLSLIEEYELRESIDWKDVFSKELKGTRSPALALKGARAKEGLTQKELAELMGTSQAHIAQMENDKREITKQTAKKLGHIFNVGYKVFL